MAFHNLLLASSHSQPGALVSTAGPSDTGRFPEDKLNQPWFHPADEFAPAVTAWCRERAPEFSWNPLLRIELRHNLRRLSGKLSFKPLARIASLHAGEEDAGLGDGIDLASFQV